MADKPSDNEDSWTLVGEQDESEDSCNSIECVQVSNKSLSVSYHRDSSYCGNTVEGAPICGEEVEAEQGQLKDQAGGDCVTMETIEDGKGHLGSAKCCEPDGHLLVDNLSSSPSKHVSAESEGATCAEVIGQSRDDPSPSAVVSHDGQSSQVSVESGGVACLETSSQSQPASMFSRLGQGHQDSIESDDSDRFSADFLGRSGLELRRQASSSDSDSDFVRIEPGHLSHHDPVDMQSSGSSSVSQQFQFIRREEDEDSLMPGDVDDRCESDISLLDSEDLSGQAVADDIPIHNVPVIRNYQQKPNNNLNLCLSIMAACVLCVAVGMGIGHAIGTAREASLQQEIRQGQQERLRVLQDDLLMCLQKQDEMDTTIAKLTEIERLLKAADYWREEYEELLRSKMKNEEKWRQEKEQLTSTSTGVPQLVPHGRQGVPLAYYAYLSEKRNLLKTIKVKERDILNLRLKLDLQKAITKEHIQLENRLKDDMGQSEDTKHHLETEVSLLKVEKENLEEKLQEEHEDDVILQSTIDSLRSENSDLKNKLTLEERDAHQLEEKIALLEAELSHEVMDDISLESEIMSLRREIGHLRTTIEEMVSREENMTRSTGFGELDNGHCTVNGMHLEQRGLVDVTKYTKEMQDVYLKSALTSLPLDQPAILDLTTSAQDKTDSLRELQQLYSIQTASLSAQIVRQRHTILFHGTVNHRLNTQLRQCQKDGVNITQPTFSSCLSLLLNCSACSDVHLENISSVLHMYLAYFMNSTLNSEFMEYLQRKQTDYTSSEHFKHFSRQFRSAFEQAQNIFQSGWKNFRKANHSENFKKSADNAKQTVNRFWKKFQRSDTYASVMKAADQTSKVLNNVSHKVSDKVQSTVNHIHRYGAPVLQKLYNSTRDTVLNIPPWRDIKEATKKFTNSRKSSVKEMYQKVKENVAEGWRHVKESCSWCRKEQRASKYYGKEAKVGLRKPERDDDDDYDDDDDDDDDDGDDGDGEKDGRVDKKYKENHAAEVFKKGFGKYVLYLHALGVGETYGKMTKKDKRLIYQKLKDFGEDHRHSVIKLGKKGWFFCQLQWWSQAAKGGHMKSAESCDGDLMDWQVKLSKSSSVGNNRVNGSRKAVTSDHDSDGGWYFRHYDNRKVVDDAAWYFHRSDGRDHQRHDSRQQSSRVHYMRKPISQRRHHNVDWIERRARERAQLRREQRGDHTRW